MSQRQIFKVAILSHDEPLFQRLIPIFGVDFEKGLTQTSGASFSYSHFQIPNGQRLTAQFWMLDASPQWHLVRNLYLKGASGIILLHDASVKNASAMNKRLIREFVTTNRFPVPIIVFSIGDSADTEKTKEFAKDIERWAGYQILTISEKTDNVDEILADFMAEVKDWRARNVIFQTLKLYFELDAISQKKREINKIISQLRRIYTASYYELVTDEEIYRIIQQAVLMEGFKYDPNEKAVLYQKEISNNPWSYYEGKIGPSEFEKPSVKKLD